MSYFLLAIVVVIVVIILVTAGASIWFSTPYWGTPSSVVHAMVGLAGLTNGEKACDIGAGDGRILIEAKNACDQADVWGYEIALGIWLLGRWRIFLSRKDVHLYFRNALREDLSSTDVIFLYVGPEMMRWLESKFERELKPGTRIISHVFRFPNHSPVKEVPVRVGSSVKKIYLYIW